MDFTTSQRVAELRREIEDIRERNTIFVLRRRHSVKDCVANEERRDRLEEIKQQLDALRSKRVA
jgi:hypothetical protein